MIPPVANRFVAGEDTDAALEHVAEVNARNVGAILNLLGEHYSDEENASDDTDSYVDLVRRISDEGHRACVSVKPSQIGLMVGEDTFRSNLERLLDAATDSDVLVWLDMEDSSTTDATLDAYRDYSGEHRIGVCLQANLRRTRDDIGSLPGGGKIRLVKGAYDEPEEIAYKEKSRVNESFVDCVEEAFRKFDGDVALGTHDDAMLDRAEELAGDYGRDFEVQMLMGVRESLQYELAEERDVWQYVPYGSKWISYFYRRVRERKENLFFAARAVLGV